MTDPLAVGELAVGELAVGEWKLVEVVKVDKSGYPEVVVIKCDTCGTRITLERIVGGKALE